MSFSDVWKELARLEDEIDIYFSLLASFESEREEHKAFRSTLEPNTSLILKGASFLVLYNFVEAIARSGMQALFDRIKQRKLNPHELTEELVKEWIHQRQKNVELIDACPARFIEITNEMIKKAMSKCVVELSHKDVSFSGNVDLSSIVRVFKSHGIPFSPSSGGRTLDVRNKRNWLSHGNESFVTCGREVTLSDLQQYRTDVTSFVRDFLNAIESYANSSGFTKSP